MLKQLSLDIFQNEEFIGIALTCAIAFAILYVLFKFVIKLPEEPSNDEFKEKDATPPKDLKGRPLRSVFVSSRTQDNKLYRKDWFFMILITVMYAIVSLWQLGSTQMPSTSWQPVEDTEYMILEVTDEDPSFDAIYAIGGEGDNNANPDNYQIGFNNIQIMGSNDKTDWTHITYLNDNSYLQWMITQGDWNFRYICIKSTNKNSLLTEIAFKKKGVNEFLNMQVDEDSAPDSPYPASLVIDEQDKIPFDQTYMTNGYFDEIYHPRNAWEIANGQYMYASVHPLLGTTIIALGIKLFGINPFGWRIMGALFGIIMLPLFYLICKRMFKKRYLATIGTALFAADFMHLTTSRIGTLEPFSVFFIMLMYYFMIKYFYTSFYDTDLKKQFKYLALCGFSAGLAISTKFTGIYAAAGIAVLFFINFGLRVHEYSESKRFIKRSERLLSTSAGKTHAFYEEELEKCKKAVATFKTSTIKTAICCVIVFIILPLAMYWASYIVTPVWRDGYGISKVWDHTWGMYTYHRDLVATHPFQSTWYEWILDLRPIWYYSGNVNDVRYSVSCFNNPLISWVGFISILMTAYITVKNKSRSGMIILAGYLSAILPWVSVTRCVFSYHYYPSYPFLILAIVFVANWLLKKDMRYKKTITGFVIVCIVIFVLFLPATAGFGTHQYYIDNFLEWLPRWYLG